MKYSSPILSFDIDTDTIPERPESIVTAPEEIVTTIDPQTAANGDEVTIGDDEPAFLFGQFFTEKAASEEADSQSVSHTHDVVDLPNARHQRHLRHPDSPPETDPLGAATDPGAEDLAQSIACVEEAMRRAEDNPGARNIKLGSTLSNDRFAGERFHYCLANPPFGKKWEKDQTAVTREHTEKGYAGRFGPGLPRINDGSMLFLLHLASKMERPEHGGGRVAIVLSGSPLFNGGAGSGESEIRRWLLEQDLIEAIIALPTEIFFRTGIGTYLWVLSNKKPAHRREHVQLIDATGLWTPIKNEGNKRRLISDDQIRQITHVYAAAETGGISRLLDYRTFGYRRIKVLRPLRMRLHIHADSLDRLRAEKAWGKLTESQQTAWEAALTPHLGQTHSFAWAETFAAEAARTSAAIGKVGKPFIKALINAFGERDPEGDPVTDKDGRVVPDSELTDYENVPLTESIEAYVAREVLPHVPDAYVDESFRDERDGGLGRVGYEINFNRYFYQYTPPRPLDAIDAELKQVEAEIAALLGEVTE